MYRLEGYNTKGKPNINWWLEQLKAGERYRQLKARQDKWEVYNMFYRNHFRPGIFTKNMFFTMRRSLVPRTYFRNPSISVTPTKPGMEHLALSRIMERVLNSLTKTMDIKRQMQRMVDTAFITGTGVGKLGFGAQRTPTPEPGGTEIPIDKEGRRYEYQMGLQDNMPWFQAITDVENFILPQDCVMQESAWFQAHRLIPYEDDVISDPRYPKGAFKDHVARKKSIFGSLEAEPVIFGSADMPSRDTIELMEIRDRRNRQVLVLAPGRAEDALIQQDDELQTDHSSPFYIYTPNPDVFTVWGVADASILYPYQLQLNEIKTKMHWHMRRSLVKLLAETGILDPEQEAKFLREDVSAVVYVANINKIKIIETDHIPDALFRMEAEVMNDIRETMGFNRNAFGEYQAKSHGPTATETREVARALDLRMDERRDNLADTYMQIMEDTMRIIFRHWGREQVIKVLDPQGVAVWVRFTGTMLKQGDYEIKINPDSSLPETKEIREKRALAYYDRLSQNPLVSNLNLTKFLLGELPGVSLEDILLEQPAQTAQPLSMAEYANRLSGGVQAIPPASSPA
jgi:hypothetical protein